MPLISNVNIKELPVVEEINATDYLIVETDKGTQIISFDNFVVGPDNITFYNDIISLSSQSVFLSASLVNNTNRLSASVNDLVNAQLASLSTTVDAKYRRIFYQAGTLNIDANQLTSDAASIPVPTGVTLDVQDISLTFNSAVVPAVSGLLINPFPVLFGSPPAYSLQAVLTSPSVVQASINYNIAKPY